MHTSSSSGKKSPSSGAFWLRKQRHGHGTIHLITYCCQAETSIFCRKDREKTGAPRRCPPGCNAGRHSESFFKFLRQTESGEKLSWKHGRISGGMGATELGRSSDHLLSLINFSKLGSLLMHPFAWSVMLAPSISSLNRP
jgi:hypothetical protein